MADTKGRKRGADGLTKQQRYVQRHKSAVNAANAQRIRARRAALKLDQVEDTALKEKAPGVPCESTIASDRLTTQTEEPAVLTPPKEPFDLFGFLTVQEEEQANVGLPSDSTVDPPVSSYSEGIRREIYNSTFFDEELDRDLAAMDAFDAANEAMDSAVKLHEEYGGLHEDVNSLLTFLSSRWNFQKGWHFKRAFLGSNSQRRFSHYLARTNDLLDESKKILPLLPVGKTMWKDTLDIIIWASGASSFMWLFLAALAPDSDNEDNEDEDNEDEDEVLQMVIGSN